MILNEKIDKLECPFIQVCEQTLVKDQDHLNEEMVKVLEKGGEGLMIKDPESMYERRRSDLLLKIKKFDDAEAKVLSHESGTGKNAFVMGAIHVEDIKTKVHFKIGSGFTDKERRKPPKIGSIVTYKHQGKSKNGIPRFPIYLRDHPGM